MLQEILRFKAWRNQPHTKSGPGVNDQQQHQHSPRSRQVQPASPAEATRMQAGRECKGLKGPFVSFVQPKCIAHLHPSLPVPLMFVSLGRCSSCWFLAIPYCSMLTRWSGSNSSSVRRRNAYRHPKERWDLKMLGTPSPFCPKKTDWCSIASEGSEGG